jgi:hypothetical protein
MSRSARPHGGERQLDGGDPSPGTQAVALGGKLERGRAGGVIRCDHVEVAVAERSPECLTVRAFPNGRCTLEPRRPIGDGLGIEDQVVWTGLRRERKPLGARATKNRDRTGCRDMHDMDARAGLAGERDEQCDGLLLRFWRARVQPGRMASRVG